MTYVVVVTQTAKDDLRHYYAVAAEHARQDVGDYETKIAERLLFHSSVKPCRHPDNTTECCDGSFNTISVASHAATSEWRSTPHLPAK